jgi:hypothetical protein
MATPSMATLMSADTSPADRPDTLPVIATSRVRSRRLIWLEPVDSRDLATWSSRTIRLLPSALLPSAKGRPAQVRALIAGLGCQRTFTS